MNICRYCLAETKNKYYCNKQCRGFNMRGKPRGQDLIASYGTSKHHIAIRIRNLLGESKRVYLHRFKVEHLIRPLKKGEIVHHIDDNRFNNNDDNLEICTNQSEHLERHYQDKSGIYKRLNEFETIGNEVVKW